MQEYLREYTGGSQHPCLATASPRSHGLVRLKVAKLSG